MGARVSCQVRRTSAPVKKDVDGGGDDCIGFLCLGRRTLTVNLSPRAQCESLHLVFDVAGFKVYGKASGKYAAMVVSSGAHGQAAHGSP